MIYSLYIHPQRRFAYYEAPGVTPPHGWFRKPTPGMLRQPEEMAARLPANARLVGYGPLPRGLVATNMPGVGSVDRDTAADGKGAGLGGFGQVSPQQPRPFTVTHPGVVGEVINTNAVYTNVPRYYPGAVVPRSNRPFAGTDDAWDSGDNRGWTER